MNQLVELIAANTGFGIEEIKPETRLDSMVADSLDFLSLIIDVQSQFDVKIPDWMIPKLHTVEDLYGAIHGHVPA